MWRRFEGLADHKADDLNNDIRSFLSRIEVAHPEPDEFGFTWIELYILYKSLGYRCAAEAPSTKAKAKPSIGAHMKAFKLAVRKIVRQEFEGNDRDFFKPGAKKGYALRRIGINNHFPMLNLKPNISDEIQKHLDKEMLRANRSRIKDLKEQVEGHKEVEVKDLVLKHKALWSKAVRSLPDELRKEFKEVSLRNKKSKAAVKTCRRLRRGVARSRVAKPRLPEHDCAKLVCSTGKRLCQPALQRGQLALKLSPGMLSAKLRAKFGHLCTGA